MKPEACTRMLHMVRTMWVMEWCPKGAFVVHPLMTVLQRNLKACMDHNQEAMPVMLGLFPTMETALEAEREMKRRKHAERTGETADGVGGDGTADQGGTRPGAGSGGVPE
jgi:hypothetical protein